MAGSVATGSGTAGDGVEEVSGGHRPAWGQHGGGQWRTAADGVEVCPDLYHTSDFICHHGNHSTFSSLKYQVVIGA
uniref:Uncharacterized protein n=1 Tax=Oryza sativa subsp. japonica TaxID=39947 RepID=Q2QRW6_ORYSJ|nr:hypothetical protein LOC_Os12g26160 [Oryza sativa Japonica Group]